MRGRLLLVLVIAWMVGSPIPAYAQVTLQVRAIDGGESRNLDFGTANSLGPEGGETLHSDTVIRRVRLTIASGSSGRYKVFQQVNEPWANPAGEPLPLESIRFQVSETQPRGDVRVPQPTPLELGEKEIYLSDPSGSGTELFVTYTAQIPVGQQAGRYRTSVTYRVISQ